MPGENRFVVGTPNNLELIDADTFEVLRKWDDAAAAPSIPEVSICFDPQGQWFVVGGGLGARIHDAESLEVVRVLLEPGAECSSLAVDPSGS